MHRFSATRDKLGQVTATGLILAASVAEGERSHRKELLELIRGMTSRVEEVLDKFNRKYPAALSHVERAIPEDR